MHMSTLVFHESRSNVQETERALQLDGMLVLGATGKGADQRAATG